jgi:hypothetical protein
LDVAIPTTFVLRTNRGHGRRIHSAARCLHGTQFNPEITLKALSFFDDGDLRRLPEPLKARLATAAREVNLDRLPDADDLKRDWERRR